jgi:transposase
MRQIESLLSEKQWLKIESLLPKHKPSARVGRPPADNRAVVEGILWVLKTGARWRDLPPQYPSPSSCWRRLRDWKEQEVWHSFIAELDEANHLDWEETFADGSFAPAKKGALESAKPERVKEPSGWRAPSGQELMAKEFL